MDPNNPQDPALNPQGDPADTPPAPTPADDDNQPAAPDQPDNGGQGDEPPAPDDQPDAGAKTPDAAKPGMSRGERRIRQLSEKVKQAHQVPYQQPGGAQPSPQMPQYDDGQVVSAQQLQQDVVQTASAIAQLQVQQQLQQRDAVSNFDRDSETIPTKYEELNPENPNFTPELDEAIAQEFQERAFRPIYNQQGQVIGQQLDPSVRLADIAARHVKAARGYAAKVSADQRTRTDAAADTTAPRPGGERPAERKFEDLSLDEMRAKVGYHKV